MRYTLLASALAAFSVIAPAKAALFRIEFSGYVSGIQNVYDPNQFGCNGGGPGSTYCNTTGPFGAFIQGSVLISGDTPTGYFQYGDSRSIGFYSGTIIGSVADGIRGVNLSYGRDQAGGPFYQFGTAPTFMAQLVSIDGNPAPAPAPEPTTWAMLVAGFGAIGRAMRVRRWAARMALA